MEQSTDLWVVVLSENLASIYRTDSRMDALDEETELEAPTPSLAGQLADLLHDAVLRGECNDIVLIGAPDLLLAVKDRLSPQADGKILRAIGQDWSEEAPESLSRLLQSDFADRADYIVEPQIWEAQVESDLDVVDPHKDTERIVPS